MGNQRTLGDQKDQKRKKEVQEEAGARQGLTAVHQDPREQPRSLWPVANVPVVWKKAGSSTHPHWP